MQKMIATQSFKDKVFHADPVDRKNEPDFVMPIGPSAALLAHMTVRRPIASALDLGTGCGIQAILAADHADSVLATDINPRALEVTRFNAEQNGIANIRTAQGSYLDPVHGKRFDLIVANLPYVITPHSQYLYRDMASPARSDSLDLLKQLDPHLNANGWAHLNLSWVHSFNVKPWQPVLEAIRTSGMDGMLFLAADLTPEEYAALWLTEAEADKINEWSAWYRAHDMERMALGHLVLRKRVNVKPWFTIFALNTNIQTDTGSQVERLFMAQDHLQDMRRLDELWETAFLPADLNIRPAQNGKVSVTEPSAFQFSIRIYESTAEALPRFDGRTSVRHIVRRKTPEILHDLSLLFQFDMIHPN